MTENPNVQKSGSTMTGRLMLTNDAIQWDDSMVPPLSVGTGPSAPSLGNAGASTLQTYTFQADTQDDQVWFAIQMPHRWKTGTAIYPHIHWTAPTSLATAGANSSVVWCIEYNWASLGGAYGTSSVSNFITNVVAATAYTHQISSFSAIDATGKGISSILNFRLWRKGTDAGADKYGQAAALLGFDVHYEVDGFGSDLETSKAY